MNKFFTLTFSLLFLAAGCTKNPPLNIEPILPTPTIANNNNTPEIKTQFKEPVNNALQRITKKPFGLQVSPQNSLLARNGLVGIIMGLILKC